MTVAPDELRRVAHAALADAERVAHHTALLGSAARDRPLGHGRYGTLVEHAVRPLLHTLVDDLAKTATGILQSLGEGLLVTARTVEVTDDAIRHEMRGEIQPLG